MYRAEQGVTDWSRDQFAPASRANVSSAARSFSDVEKTHIDVVPESRKVASGVAVVALPDDLAATALKLSHVRISWVNCRIRAREEAARCYLPLLEPWTRGRSLQGSRPHGALLPMRPEGPPSKGLQRPTIVRSLPRTRS
ncbi:unnamed protein product [Trichogramma brassicae]|uniref:Uncharacterized protein n=1 Tax=Trichogramma brassicae TaxID=86971 RepID=A0A6H5HTT2_9HYME|nr:unnamed protein product [Trichogramma brassicae]